uniref:Peptidase S8/S53 domain-containing protein n=1 Tax=Panagrolaimus davidi TaxID=227884 RepID=A0A914PGE7_9BILA
MRRNVENYIFTIGAVLTSEVQKRAYYIFGINDTNPPPPVVYSWSSRGPGGFKSRGVDFVAPGVLRRKTSTISFENFFHGTNYASPNAAGAVACLLSGLKSKSIEYSPDLIKFALFKTAFLPKNGKIFEFGHGIIQINEAFDYFCKNVKDFKNIPKLSNVAEGIMFIPNDGKEQVFLEESIDLSSFINYENQDTTKLKLQVSKNAENFMEVSKTDENNLSFFVKVDTNKLEAGNSNFGEIMILHPKIGSIFNIPIFVCNPIKVSETQNFYIKKEAFLTFDKPYRIRFYPENINICDIKITASKCLITNCWIQYCFPYSMNVKEANNTKKFLVFSRIKPSEKFSIKVNKNEVFDVCIYQMVCATLPNAKFTLEFNFKNDEQKEGGEAADGTV